MSTKIKGISVSTYGDKKNQPVIFIHGFPFDHTMWLEQIKVLKEDYFCIAYDVRGLGKSEVGDGQHTLEMFVDDLFDIMDEMNIVKPFLCGLSMGGYISLRALEIAQERFKGVILCDTRSDADNDEGKLKRANSIKQINSEGAGDFVENFISGLFCNVTKEENPELYYSFINKYKISNPIGVKGALIAIMSRTDTTASLSKISIPALVLCGAFDTLTPPVVMRAMSEKIKGSEFAAVPMAGHLAPLENPGCVNDLIGSFLKRHQ